MDWLMGLCLHFHSAPPPTRKIFIRNSNMKDHGLACFRVELFSCRVMILNCFSVWISLCLSCIKNSFVCHNVFGCVWSICPLDSGHKGSPNCHMLMFCICPNWKLSLLSLCCWQWITHFLKTHWRMTKNAAATVSWIHSQWMWQQTCIREGGRWLTYLSMQLLFLHNEAGRQTLPDPPSLARSHHLSLTSKHKSIQLDGWRQLAADAGGHTPLHSHNGPWHNWGPRNRQHSRSFQEAGCLQVTSNTACPCLSALTKRKECFPPQHGCVGIKTHSEWPWVVQQMLARIALVAVPTVSRQARPAQTTLSLCTCMVEGVGAKSQWRACHTL